MCFFIVRLANFLFIKGTHFFGWKLLSCFWQLGISQRLPGAAGVRTPGPSDSQPDAMTIQMT